VGVGDLCGLTTPLCKASHCLAQVFKFLAFQRERGGLHKPALCLHRISLVCPSPSSK